MKKSTVENKIISVLSGLELNLNEAQLMFVKLNEQFRRIEVVRHAFKVINLEYFGDLLLIEITKLIENGTSIKALSKSLGDSIIQTLITFFVRVTEKMETDTVDGFENHTNSLCIPNNKEISCLD